MGRFTKLATFIMMSFIAMMLCGCSSLSFNIEYNNGMKYYNSKQYAKAIDSFNKALIYKPDSYSAICFLGASYAYNKDINSAEKTFWDAIKMSPNDWNAYVLLADLKKRQRNYDSSIELLETAVSLESMGGSQKNYYKDYIKKLKDERSIYALKDPLAQKQAKEKFKNEIAQAHAKDKSVTSEKKFTGDVILSLDSKKWTKFLEQKDDKTSVVQYCLKDEDAINQKWSKLVTVQYFSLSDNFNTTLNEYYSAHIADITLVAKNAGKSFEKKIINQTKTEILYEWEFGDGIESEISRIVFTPQGIYHLHIAKKGKLTTEEKALFVDIFSNALLQ